jgi:hypothetical protein
MDLERVLTGSNAQQRHPAGVPPAPPAPERRRPRAAP